MMTPPTIDQSVIERVASAQTLGPMICEMLSHRGERPNRVLRGGQELWETWVPSVQAGLRYSLSPSPIAGKEGRSVDPEKVAGRLHGIWEQLDLNREKPIGVQILRLIKDLGGFHYGSPPAWAKPAAELLTPPAECVATPGEVGKLCERLLERASEDRTCAENSKVVVGLFQPQMDMFEARTGHNLYAVRMAVDHRNSAKRDTLYADDLTQAANLLTQMEAREQAMREAISAVLPSAAGAADQPDTKVIAFYINMGELRALRALLTGAGS